MRRLLIALLLVSTQVAGPPADLRAAAAATEDPIYDPYRPEGSVYRLYRAFFLREPDRGGYVYWLERHEAGLPLGRIADGFVGSDEFRGDYGTTAGGDFVRLVYRNVLDRDPDDAGFRYWTDRLERGMTRGSLMLNFSESDEFRSETLFGVPPGHRPLVQRFGGGVGTSRHDVHVDVPVFVRVVTGAASCETGPCPATTLDVDAVDGAGDGAGSIYRGNTASGGEERFVEPWREIAALGITADGTWQVTILPMTAAPAVGASFSGHGDAVRARTFERQTAVRFRHDGESNFIVSARAADGRYLGTVANRLGAVDGDGRVPAGTAYLQVIADGDWTIGG